MDCFNGKEKDEEKKSLRRGAYAEYGEKVKGLLGEVGLGVKRQ